MYHVRSFQISFFSIFVMIFVTFSLTILSGCNIEEPREHPSTKNLPVYPEAQEFYGGPRSKIPKYILSYVHEKGGPDFYFSYSLTSVNANDIIEFYQAKLLPLGWKQKGPLKKFSLEGVLIHEYEFIKANQSQRLKLDIYIYPEDSENISDLPKGYVSVVLNLWEKARNTSMLLINLTMLRLHDLPHSSF